MQSERDNPLWAGPPHDFDELRARATWLEGRALSELSAWLNHKLEGPSLRRKGHVGQLIERALGVNPNSDHAPDFAKLGVELKTLPIDDQGRPTESTFVCSLALKSADTLEWEDSVVRAKLAHVLWVPIVVSEEPCVGTPFFWRPTHEQEQVLREDFEAVVSLIALGRVEELDARLGRWLQVRPKAAHSRVRTLAFGADGEPLRALPRGFYLRARVTRALLADPASLAFST